MDIRPFELADEAAVVALWEACDLTRPWNNPLKDIHRKMAVRGDWFLVGLVDGRIVASVMAGYDGHRGWLYYLAVAPEQQRRGYGREIVAEAERLLCEAGCPKINLQVRGTNTKVLAFYHSVGYATEDIVSLGKRLEEDGPRPT